MRWGSFPSADQPSGANAGAASSPPPSRFPITSRHGGLAIFAHGYFRLEDTPNTPEATESIRTLLHRLADRFDNDVVKIDTSVYNASRITKVVGTVARKGTDGPGRPYRMARLCTGRSE